jgi:hypothetical protein
MKEWVFTLMCLVILVASPVMGAVNSLHLSNGSVNTFFRIELSGALSEAAPGDIDSIAITGPDGPLPYTRSVFTYSEITNVWRGFYLIVAGEPQQGNYDFTIASGATSVTTHDTQGAIKTIPNPDTSTFRIQGNTFSWGLVGPSGGELYYVLQINDTDASGALGRTVFFSSSVKNGVSMNVPDGVLTPGQTYRWRVRVADTSNWVSTQNESFSAYVKFTWRELSSTAEIRGTVADAVTGKPIAGATISLEPGSITLISQTDGTFSSSGIPSGTSYSAQISASNYNSKTLSGISFAPGPSNQLDLSLVPYAPKVTSTAGIPSDVGNDGQSTTLLTARVTHPLGLSSVETVLADLRQIGGNAEQVFYDDGSNGDLSAEDGVYSYEIVVGKGTKAKLYSLNVTAIDVSGKKGSNPISLNVKDKLSGTVQPSQTLSQSFDNTLGGQTLNIHFGFMKAVSGLKALKSGCQVELTILGPDGSEYGPYSITDVLDVSIPTAAPGEWKYVTNNQCTSAVSYEVETSGSGTGVLVGRVTDAITGGGLQGASINCNTGGATVSLDQGYFSSVAVAGTGVVTTARAGYQTNVKGGVHVKAGATTNLSIQVVPQNASPQDAPSGIHIFNILDPAEDPKPPTQPFAAKVTGSNLEFNAIVARYQQPVDVYLGLTINDAQHAGKFFLVNESDSLVELTDTLYSWRKASTKGDSAQVLEGISSAYPMGSYTLYSLVTTNSSTLSNYDLSFFTTTLAQPAPIGQNVTYISDPVAEPNPLTQPLAAKITGGNLILTAHFPMQKEPVAIFLAYTTPSGELYLIKQDGSRQVFTDTLWPWREDVTGAIAEQVLSMPGAELSRGIYYIYSLVTTDLVTTDPVSLSNYDLLFFSMSVPQ